jgi:hypothetical protein
MVLLVDIHPRLVAIPLIRGDRHWQCRNHFKRLEHTLALEARRPQDIHLSSRERILAAIHHSPVATQEAIQASRHSSPVAIHLPELGQDIQQASLPVDIHLLKDHIHPRLEQATHCPSPVPIHNLSLGPTQPLQGRATRPPNLEATHPQLEQGAIRLANLQATHPLSPLEATQPREAIPLPLVAPLVATHLVLWHLLHLGGNRSTSAAGFWNLTELYRTVRK